MPLIIFHCEFSQKRGPRAFRTLRNKDREINFKNWPHLDFPEIYMLEEGYSAFYSNFPVSTFFGNLSLSSCRSFAKVDMSEW